MGAQGSLSGEGTLSRGQKEMREESCENLGQVILLRRSKCKGPEA